MPLVALKAHFDGKQIRLDDAFDLPVGAELVVILNDFSGHQRLASVQVRDEELRPLRTVVRASAGSGDEDEPTALAYTPDEFFGTYENDDDEEPSSERS